MFQVRRRSLLRSGLILGCTAALGSRSLPVRAAPTQTLLMYNGQHAQTAAAVIAAFTKETGIEVQTRKGTSGELARQLIEEGESSPADLFYAEGSPALVKIASKGLFAPIEAATRKHIGPQYQPANGAWIGTSARCRAVAYNKAQIKESALPASILDFATDKWHGKVAFVPSSGAFLEQVMAIAKLKGRPVALAWLKGLKENGRTYTGNMAALRAVESGEVSVALINHYYWFVLEEDIGTAKMKSALHYQKDHDPGALITVSGIGVMKGAPNAASAQKFVAFMVSEAGQKALAESVAEYPLRAGVKSPFAVKPLDEIEAAHITIAELGDAAEAQALCRESGLI